ncbi:hypothetical protein DPMN_163976 [Dreissena polymorpha]|uniref:Uncharacterized protein n=1 Tax=Dreissena polymorpha TaxID=45954 RepID=A0A9D4EUA2_DREPO|nr:hypothetical protein DPMN_163976 [Dreissena polymorpha]
MHKDHIAIGPMMLNVYLVSSVQLSDGCLRRAIIKSIIPRKYTANPVVVLHQIKNYVMALM